MTVQIAAIRIIKALFIQGVLVLLVFIFFRFRLQVLCEIGFSCCVRLICSDLHLERKFHEDYC